MRTSLRWTLGATLLATAAALLWPQAEPRDTVAAVAPGKRSAGNATAPGTPTAVSPSEPLQAPKAQATPALDKPSFDPFVGAQPPAPAAPPPPKPLVGPVYQPPPAPPSVNYRFLGRMVDPAGQAQVYLARADKDVAVGVGSRLDEGYVVEAITDDAVRLLYPSLGARVVIPIPQAQASLAP